MVELVETRTARIVWAETFDQKLDDAFIVLDEIGNRIVACVASEIETSERNRAVLQPPNSLDAWEAHHRGLWHMYRFTRQDNDHARHFFEMSVRLDPTFARAHAGLSFTHFQSAFQGWGPRGPEIDRAFQTAGQSLMVDDRDPAAHWAMGRALWLRGEHGQSFLELEQAVDLSPNFAMGHYTLAFVRSQAGNPDAAVSASDHARHLSPYDPHAVRHAGCPRDGPGAHGAVSRRPPSGASRPRLARTPTLTSGQSAPTRWRSPGRSIRAGRNSLPSTARCRATAWTTS